MVSIARARRSEPGLAKIFVCIAWLLSGGIDREMLLQTGKLGFSMGHKGGVLMRSLMLSRATAMASGTAIFLVTAMLLAPATLAAGASVESGDAAARNKALARELFAAISRADVAKLDELYADDIVLWTAGALPFSGKRNKAQALEGMKMIDGMFPSGIEFTIVAMTAEGDRVAIEATSKGMHVSGAAYENEYHFLMVVRDGRIVQFKEYMDTLLAKEVLLQPPPATSP
jgi:ketosteroid isomerase-like protein